MEKPELKFIRTNSQEFYPLNQEARKKCEEEGSPFLVSKDIFRLLMKEELNVTSVGIPVAESQRTEYVWIEKTSNGVQVSIKNMKGDWIVDELRFKKLKDALFFIVSMIPEILKDNQNG